MLNFNKLEIKVSFLIIFLIGLGLRLFYFPNELPLIVDGVDYFTYATAINFYDSLPNEWAPANIGWPIFLSFWFSLVNLDNTLNYMQFQQILAIILSSLTIFPVYFLCKKFFNDKISLVGASLFAFEPRIILNSTFGITEPLFILLGIISLLLFLRYDKIGIIIAFILASFTTIIRSEGIFLLITISILFFIKYKISKEILKTYLPALIIFFLILTPILMYKTEVSGSDGVFGRMVTGTNQMIGMTNVNASNDSKIFDGLKLFVKYLGWIMIPSFLLFVPFGIIQFFRKRTKENNFIIIVLIIYSIPILYAYFRQAQDTRYFYTLYPIFCLISLFAVETYISKFTKKNLIILFLIIGILISSVVFYEYNKIDYQKEIEYNKIAQIISNKVSGTNFHPIETKYIRVTEIPTEWPFLFYEKDGGINHYQIKSISTTNYYNLEDFILNSKNDLTHLVVDDNQNLPKFLQDVYYDDEKYEYLNKIFDSKDNGFNYHVKVYEIDFEKFEFNMKK
jgi:hypothetical protein